VDPYRSPPSAPQFICVVCYRTLSVHAGECLQCGVERLSLADPAVRADVRAEAERRLQNRQGDEWFWLYLAAWIVTALPVFFLVHAIFWRFAVWVATTLVLGSANVKLYERLNVRSVLRLYADRRRRHALEAAGAPKALPPARADDPEDAELTHVLELLGARVEK